MRLIRSLNLLKSTQINSGDILKRNTKAEQETYSHSHSTPLALVDYIYWRVRPASPPRH